MRDLVFSLVLILATVGFIALIRLVTGGIKSPCSRPTGVLKVYFDENCECLEYTLGRILNSTALTSLNLRVTVVDKINTEESRKWLTELQRKLARDFEIETEGDRDGTADSDDKRNG